MNKLKEGKAIIEKAEKIDPWNYFIANNHALFSFELKEYETAFKYIKRYGQETRAKAESCF